MKRVLCVLLLVAFLVACSATSDQKSSPYLQDYDQLWQDLYENYPYSPVLEQQGIDAESVRQTYREYARKADTTEEFMKTLDLMFAKLYCFGHLSLIHRDRYDLLLESEPLRDPDAFAPWSEILHDPVTTNTYSLLPSPETSPQTEPSSVTCSYYEEINAAYFRFPVMDTGGGGNDQTLIADYLSQLPDVEHIIIDVTGNPGGSTQYWEEVIVKPFGGSWSASFPIYYQDSPMVHRYYHKQNLQAISETDDLPSFARTWNAKWYALSGWEMHCGDPALENGVGAKRWVLIDNGGYSATEAFASFCKLTGWAKLVGEPTAGDGLGGQPLLLQLKNTGLLVYFSVGMAENPDGTLNAARGIQPDHICQPKENQSPLELCIDIISQQ